MDVLLKDLRLNGKPTDEEFSQLSAKLDFKVDSDYLAFIRAANGAEGFVKNSFLQLWEIKDLISLNPYYDSAMDDGYSEAIFFIGSNGSDTGYGIRKKDGVFIAVAFLDMNDSMTVELGKSFYDFVYQLSEQL